MLHTHFAEPAVSPDLVTGVSRSQQFCGQQPPRRPEGHSPDLSVWPGRSEGSVSGCRTRGKGTVPHPRLARRLV